jgi:hypothetical protein
MHCCLHFIEFYPESLHVVVPFAIPAEPLVEDEGLQLANILLQVLGV